MYPAPPIMRQTGVWALTLAEHLASYPGVIFLQSEVDATSRGWDLCHQPPRLGVEKRGDGGTAGSESPQSAPAHTEGTDFPLVRWCRRASSGWSGPRTAAQELREAPRCRA